MTARTVNAILRLCENQLGWDPGARMPAGTERRLQTKKLSEAIVAKPNLYTFENFALAVEYLRRKRQPIQSPAFLTYIVPEALKYANQQAAPTPLAAQVETALDRERQTPEDERSQYWIGRLTRATGNGREEALALWRAERGVR